MQLLFKCKCLCSLCATHHHRRSSVNTPRYTPVPHCAACTSAAHAGSGTLSESQLTPSCHSTQAPETVVHRVGAINGPTTAAAAVSASPWCLQRVRCSGMTGVEPRSPRCQAARWPPSDGSDWIPERPLTVVMRLRAHAASTGRPAKAARREGSAQACDNPTAATVNGGEWRFDSDERRHMTRHFTRRDTPASYPAPGGLPGWRTREWSPFQLVVTPCDVRNIRTTPPPPSARHRCYQT
jgi:hypothetical protein